MQRTLGYGVQSSVDGDGLAGLEDGANGALWRLMENGAVVRIFCLLFKWIFSSRGGDGDFRRSCALCGCNGSRECA